MGCSVYQLVLVVNLLQVDEMVQDELTLAEVPQDDLIQDKLAQAEVPQDDLVQDELAQAEKYQDDLDLNWGEQWVQHLKGE
ncbi:hypothetical protein GN156_33320, partial [bacterium LRH843]|nr:hypothetical protein [bacterium LRH843]